MSGGLRETTRLTAKFAVNRPIGWPEQNFMLLPNQANVMSPILMMSPFPGSAFCIPVRVWDKSVPSMNGSSSIYEETDLRYRAKQLGISALWSAVVGRHHANAPMGIRAIIPAAVPGVAIRQRPAMVSRGMRNFNRNGSDPIQWLCLPSSMAEQHRALFQGRRSIGISPLRTSRRKDPHDPAGLRDPAGRHRQTSRQASNCYI